MYVYNTQRRPNLGTEFELRRVANLGVEKWLGLLVVLVVLAVLLLITTQVYTPCEYSFFLSQYVILTCMLRPLIL